MDRAGEVGTSSTTRPRRYGPVLGQAPHLTRHEQQSVAMALSAAAHHSFDTVAAGETYHGPRAQKTDRAGAAHNALRRQTQRAARGPELFQLFEEEPAGLRPGSVPDPRPQERVQRHAVEHLTDLVRVAPMVQILGAPAPQMMDNPMDAFRVMDQPIAEQVIAVPKIVASSCPSRVVSHRRRNSQWKCRPYSTSSSRKLTFQFLVVDKVFS